MTCERRCDRASAAGSTSSSATAWPSTSSRPKPLRRSASSVAATGSTSSRQGLLRSRRAALVRRSSPDRRSARRPRRLGSATAGRRRRPACRSRSAGGCPSGSVASRAGHDLGRLADDLLAALPADTCGRRARTAGAGSRGSRSSVPTVERGLRMLFFWRIAIAGQMPSMRVDVGLLHPLEELPRVGRQRLDVAALPLGVDRVEGERRLARAADARS